MSAKVVVLTGGVGGAKLVLGLTHAIDPADVTAIVNTGDDFRHLGLAISPDIDTLLYTLSGRSDEERGWGRADEGWRFMAALGELGGPDWFNVGDRDLALHVWRSERLAAGELPSAVTAAAAACFGIAACVLPMSEQPVRTVLDTDEGTLAFQEYFVARRCQPRVHGIRMEGATEARPAPGVLDAIAAADAILIAPSNPWLSIDPILAVPGMRAALAVASARVVAVSPLVGGDAVKGPTAKLMRELGLPVSARAVAEHYGDLLDAMLVDAGDPFERLPCNAARADILMRTLQEKIRVAKDALALRASTTGDS